MESKLNKKNHTSSEVLSNENFKNFIWKEKLWIIGVPKVPFRFIDKLKYEIRNNVLIFVTYWSWGIKHKAKWFFDFQNN